MYELLTGDGPVDGGDSETDRQVAQQNLQDTAHQETINTLLTLTIKILIILVEKTLLLKVAFFKRDGNFIGVLIFRS